MHRELVVIGAFVFSIAGCSGSDAPTDSRNPTLSNPTIVPGSTSPGINHGLAGSSAAPGVGQTPSGSGGSGASTPPITAPVTAPPVTKPPVITPPVTTPPVTTPPVTTPPDPGIGMVPAGAKEPKIPAKPAMCPEIKTGNITVLGQMVQLWVGAKVEGKQGPIVFYWHGTGSSPGEASGGMGNGNSEIMAMGGVIASFSTTTMMGQNTGNNVWYTGDFAMADEILACAIDQQNVDPRRVYTAGCSAGGLQSGAMVYGRSSYLAASMPNSGGTIGAFQMDDPMHTPALITTHGMMGKDVVVIEFAMTSATETKDIAKKGGFAVDCDHGGGHCQSPAAVKNAQWQFLKDHPFGVSPEPYAAGLPANFPMFCQIVK